MDAVKLEPVNIIDQPKTPEGEELTDLEKQIVHILSIYPKLNPSMLQSAIGMPPSDWKPTLEQMIRKGLITEEFISTLTPKNRSQTYRILSLAPILTPPTTQA